MTGLWAASWCASRPPLKTFVALNFFLAASDGRCPCSFWWDSIHCAWRCHRRHRHDWRTVKSSWTYPKHSIICPNEHVADHVSAIALLFHPIIHACDWLFVLSLIGFSSVILYLALMSYIVLHILNETRPMWYFLLSAALFVLAQLAWFLLGKVICNVSALVLTLRTTSSYWYSPPLFVIGFKSQSWWIVCRHNPGNSICRWAVPCMEKHYWRWA